MSLQTLDKSRRRQPVLVERDGALELLSSAIRKTSSRSGEGFLIAGETGTGKTTLIRAALDSVEPNGGTPPLQALVSCHPSTIPYEPWISLVESQPELEERLPSPLGSQGPAAQGPHELIHQAARAILEFAAKQPIILIFDDIQWADTSSLNLLLTIAHQLQAHTVPMTLILSCETPMREGTPVASFVPALLRETTVQSIELRPLSTKGIRQIVSIRLSDTNAELTTEIIEHVRRWSGGNPLYVTEILDGLESDGGAAASFTGQRLDSLSFSLRQLAEYRLTQISENARETLELAAIVGDVVDVDLLADVSEFDMNRLIDDLEEALDSGILVEDGGTLLRFRHGIVRQSLAERQSGIRRQQRHRSVLRVLRQRNRAFPVDIAHHAEAAGEFSIAVEALEQAAQRSRDFFDLPEAAQNLRHAIHLAEQANSDAAEQDRLRLLYADSIVRNEPSGAAREFERVAARSYVRNDRATLAKARQRQATLLYETGRRHEAQTILNEVIPELEALEDWSTLAEALATALYCAGSIGDFESVSRLSTRLDAVAERMAQPNHRAVAYHTKAIADVARGDPHGSPVAVRDSIAMMMEIGKLDIATPWAAVAFFKVDLLANLHRPDEVASLINRGMELDAESNRRIGRSPGDCDCTPEFSLWWLLRGEWDRVSSVLPDPLKIRSAPQPQVLKDSVQVIAAEWAMARGDQDAASACLDYVAPSPGTPPGDHGYQQWLMTAEMQVRLSIASGDLAQAEAWIEALDGELETKPHVPGELMLELSRVRLLLAQSEAERAREIAGNVVSQARQTQNMLALIDAFQLLARAHQQLGNWEPAIGAAAEAVVAANQCDLGYLQSLAKITRLEVAHSFGDNSDPLQAEIQDLTQKMEELGAQPAVERLNRLAPRQRTGNRFGLTRREHEVLRLVAEGKTDGEVAESLYISPRTVSTHVGNMLNKTGTNNRVELSSWAHQNNALD